MVQIVTVVVITASVGTVIIAVAVAVLVVVTYNVRCLDPNRLQKNRQFRTSPVRNFMLVYPAYKTLGASHTPATVRYGAAATVLSVRYELRITKQLSDTWELSEKLTLLHPFLSQQ